MNREPIFTPMPGWTQAAMLARVISMADPQGLNRVQIELCAFSGAEHQEAQPWARVVAPFAGADRGAFWLPEVDDEVLVVFMQGDPRFPLIVGGLWNGAAQPPANIEPSGQNKTKKLKSKNGIAITMTDEQGQETLLLETPGGCKITIKDGPGSIKLEDSNGNSVELKSDGISVQAAAKVTVQASSVDVTAGMVKVDAAMATFSGMVKCEVLQTNAVISSSYTPGAGNVW